jgi:hypothetical protein
VSHGQCHGNGQCLCHGLRLGLMPVASVQVSVSEMDWCIVLFSVIVSIMVMDSVRAVEVRFVVRIRQRRSERLSICFDFRNSI